MQAGRIFRPFFYPPFSQKPVKGEYGSFFSPILFPSQAATTYLS
jgi:hypothetical protein